MHREWQRHRAAKIRGRIPGELVDGEVIFRHAREEPFHCDFGDESRHLAAQAEMLAGAEAEMALRAPLDVVGVGIGKFSPIAVARAERERDLVAAAHALAMQLDLSCDRALEALRR